MEDSRVIMVVMLRFGQKIVHIVLCQKVVELGFLGEEDEAHHGPTDSQHDTVCFDGVVGEVGVVVDGLREGGQEGDAVGFTVEILGHGVDVGWETGGEFEIVAPEEGGEVEDEEVLAEKVSGLGGGPHEFAEEWAVVVGGGDLGEEVVIAGEDVEGFREDLVEVGGVKFVQVEQQKVHPILLAVCAENKAAKYSRLQQTSRRVYGKGMKRM